MMNYYLAPTINSSLFWSRTLQAPRYNLEDLGDNRYRMSMPVPGFNESNIKVSLKDNVLSIHGHLDSEVEGDAKEAEGASTKSVVNSNRFLHKGYVASEFQKSFTLDEDTKVDDATLQDGVLHIDLSWQEPKVSKERLIKIKRS